MMTVYIVAPAAHRGDALQVGLSVCRHRAWRRRRHRAGAQPRHAPPLLTAALALWVGLCIYFALLDRTPRSYVFLLAGFTAAIIGFPCVDAPETIFATAISRVEETTLAIACTTIIGAVVLPRPLGPALLARIDGWFGSARSLCLAVLAGHRTTRRWATARRSLAADAVEIRMLTSHLAFDTSNLQSATRPIEVLERRILLLLPVLSAIGDRLAALRAPVALSPGVQALIERLAAWIAARDAAPQDGGRAAPRRDPACRARHRRRVRLGCDPADRPADAAARPDRHRA